MKRWVEHYSDLYSRQNVVTTAALDATECVPVMEDLDIEPTRDKLGNAIGSLASGKASVSDGSPSDLIGHYKTALLLPLHKVLYQCWNEGAVPQDMIDAKIVALYKNKSGRNDCNNSLLSVVCKVFARVILIHLQKLAERVYPESQCGFQAEISTVYMVFSFRQLQEYRR
ncbi:unnamed protein product [Acanthosepion pharaonis]|uniref:Reverse transcriptase domain-containing protein n=1 Tax=Acanthosepion pharaonis TaxID=158019 RepID=A0A812CD87_ACAPH|nr:unnamed protein product [Sepia pharaonis]